MSNEESLAFIGFGEAAQAFVSGWGANRPRTITAYDIKTDAEATRAELDACYSARGIDGCANPGEALKGAGAVFSLVTADSALNAAYAAADVLPAGAIWFDCNSCAPQTKRRAAEVIIAAGGRYVDVAVMAPVYPKKHHVPLLISGPDSAEAEALLLGLDMKPAIAGTEVGAASAVKMLRSVMIKGIEALSAECFLAARRAGVEEQVLSSLDRSEPQSGWHERGAYNLERMMVHGARRAAEMSEVVETLKSLGVKPRMSTATAQWQDEIAALGLAPDDPELAARADKLLALL